MIERTIWLDEKRQHIEIIDQSFLPHKLEIRKLRSVGDVFEAIRAMRVRGAPLIGASAALGLWLACREAKTAADIDQAADYLASSRPTAVNLFWAIERMRKVLARGKSLQEKEALALQEALAIIEEDIETCRLIGVHGLPLLQELAAKNPHRPLNILTHCNAGMMGCIRWGTITSPIYQAHAQGLPLHVWVDETRPRNQGAITAWELKAHGIPHSLIVDNAGGQLMQMGKVDLVLVGTDRTSPQGDVANKIGTYLKALAAKDNDIPFYVALPSTSIDWELTNALEEIEIEERNADEVHWIPGLTKQGQLEQVRISPPDTPASNLGFDITPSRLITGFITEQGICSAQGLPKLFGRKG